jgi:hypothetical protein
MQHGGSIPIAFVRKTALINFDLRDERDNAVPLLTRQQNARVSAAALLQLAYLLRPDLMDSLIDRYVPDLVDASESESRRRELAWGRIFMGRTSVGRHLGSRPGVRQALATHGCSLAGDPCPTGLANSPLPMRGVITLRSRPPTAQSSRMHCWPLPYTMSTGSMYRSSQANSRFRTIRCGPESRRRMRRTLNAGRPRARPPRSRNEERAMRGWGRRSRSFSDRRVGGDENCFLAGTSSLEPPVSNRRPPACKRARAGCGNPTV